MDTPPGAPVATRGDAAAACGSRAMADGTKHRPMPARGLDDRERAVRGVDSAARGRSTPRGSATWPTMGTPPLLPAPFLTSPWRLFHVEPLHRVSTRRRPWRAGLRRSDVRDPVTADRLGARAVSRRRRDDRAAVHAATAPPARSPGYDDAATATRIRVDAPGGGIGIRRTTSLAPRCRTQPYRHRRRRDVRRRRDEVSRGTSAWRRVADGTGRPRRGRADAPPRRN